MITSIIYYLSTNALAIVIYLTIIIIISFVLYFSIREVSLTKKSILIETTLANLNRKQQLSITAILIRTFMIIYATVSFLSNDIYLYIALAIMSDILFVILRPKRIIFEILNLASQIALIYIIHLMNNYRNQVNDDISVAIIQLLLIAFIVIYSLFFLIKDFEVIITKKKRSEESGRQKNKNRKS